MSVLVYIENAEGKFKKSTFEVISYAKAVADKQGTNLLALSIGKVAENDLADLGKYGVEKVLSASDDKLKAFINEAYASVIAEAAKKAEASIVVLSNSFSGKGLAPRVAVKMQAGLVVGAIDLPDTNNGKFIVKRSAFSGKAFAFVELASANKIITLSPNSYKVTEGSSAAKVEAFQPEVKGSDLKTRIKEVVKASDKIPLAEAELVVSGGRGLKGPENWRLIEDLAEVLGAATACSKPVSDEGWRPHEEHVGQTGITISPNLYIAIGISGAIQHLAGVSSSKNIVVINKDPDAPFFKAADYGIVGDAFEIVPKLTEAIKKIKQ
ncbi:MAG TPA: electron transfer flavoprotein subunit alpha [Sphingobacteriaceae bacterium]|nr:electron transfer flavoprotein subunit alpha [Sphingobacteriaceae bacterium]